MGNKVIAQITSAGIDDWLRSLSDTRGKRLSPTSRNNLRRVLNVAFNFARERGYSATNPAASTGRAKQIESPIGILTPSEMSRLLETRAPELIPFVEIGASADLRRSEIERLDWGEIDLSSGLIQVKAAKAKSARRRFVKLHGNVLLWLQPHARDHGRVTPPRYRELFDEARDGAQIDMWSHNALRHSFASYHLAYFKNAAALALELGHTSVNMVFQHYRELVKPSDTGCYWEAISKPILQHGSVCYRLNEKRENRQWRIRTESGQAVKKQRALCSGMMLRRIAPMQAGWSNRGNARRRSDNPNSRRGILRKLHGSTYRPPHQLTTTICAHESELLSRAFHAIGALECANIGFLGIGREVAIAAFAIGSKFERHYKLTQEPALKGFW